MMISIIKIIVIHEVSLTSNQYQKSNVSHEFAGDGISHRKLIQVIVH